MSNRILIVKHWQLFIASFGLIFTADYFTDVIAFLLGLDSYSKQYAAISIFLMAPVSLSYPILVASGLSEGRPAKTTNWQTIALAVTFLDTYPLALWALDKGLAFYGFGAINIICLITLASVPARRLRSIELKRQVGIWEYLAETFQFLAWPLGVWWIQPRLNKIGSRVQVQNL